MGKSPESGVDQYSPFPASESKLKLFCSQASDTSLGMNTSFFGPIVNQKIRE
jgi:hypothetical protein